MPSLVNDPPDHAREKRLAAAAALDYVQDGMTLGLGSGSTSAIFIDLLGERVRGGLQVRGVPTSQETRKLADAAGVPLVELNDAPDLDLTIDGADEIDPRLNLIKGGGGFLLWEKIVASASREVLIIAHSQKSVSRLGDFPLPVEVTRMATRLITRKLEALGGQPQLRMNDDEPFVTDEGNHLLDCRFGPIDDPHALAAALNAMPGVVEHGLFLDMAHRVLLARGDRVEVLTRQNV